MMLITAPQRREQDAHGSGHFGAPRGKRTHSGIDYAVLPGTRIVCPVEGRVTKLGYPYGDDLSFRYVQVTDHYGYAWRFFYVEPGVAVDDLIPSNSVIGTSQDLLGRYPGITPHLHLEIKNSLGNYVDPETLLNDW